MTWPFLKYISAQVTAPTPIWPWKAIDRVVESWPDDENATVVDGEGRLKPFLLLWPMSDDDRAAEMGTRKLIESADIRISIFAHNPRVAETIGTAVKKKISEASIAYESEEWSATGGFTASSPGAIIRVVRKTISSQLRQVGGRNVFDYMTTFKAEVKI